MEYALPPRLIGLSMWRVAWLALVALALTAACGGSDEETAAPMTEASTWTADGAPVRLEAAFGGRKFDRPTELGAYPGGRFFLADQAGVVALLWPDGSDAGLLLDLRGRVLRGGNEEGLLSVALDPAFPERPYVYVYYSATNPRRTVLSRFEVVDDQADPGGELVILEQPQPFANHNGGAIRFGPDGMLYLGLGDGGGGGDPSGSGQSLEVLLGKILRIDVRNARPERPYEAPRDNPFAGQEDARAEVWAYGLRNPWRMAFDPADGRLWVGDVGASALEEVNLIERGGNYGWNRMEGSQCHTPRSGCDQRGLTAPVAEYSHDDGCSITGGLVYRGREIAPLDGQFLYADFCSGRLWAVPTTGGEPWELLGTEPSRQVASFGEDEAGELYLLVHGGAVLRLMSVA